MTDTLTTSTRPSRWADTPGGTRRPGLRIERGQHYLFIPEADLLDLANQIADHLAGIRYTTETENR